jgi:endo-1,4-beta-xylanase
LITNPGFEGDSTTGWTAFSGGTAAISAENIYANSGTYSGFVTGRTAPWNGIATDLIATGSANTTYHVEASVRIAGAASDTVKLTFAFNCNNAGATYLDGASGTATNTGWVDLSGDVTLPACATTVTQLVFYVQGPAIDVEIYVDDVSVREVL